MSLSFCYKLLIQLRPRSGITQTESTTYEQHNVVLSAVFFFQTVSTFCKERITSFGWKAKISFFHVALGSQFLQKDCTTFAKLDTLRLQDLSFQVYSVTLRHLILSNIIAEFHGEVAAGNAVGTL